MKDFSSISNNRIPFHTHRGKNILRILVIILLTALFLFSIYSIKYVGYVMITVLLACLFGLLCVRFPKIYLYNDCFEIVKKGMIKKFTDKDVFNYKDLNKVEFSGKYTDWNFLIVLSIFGSGGFGGNSKADQMIINTTDNKTYLFNRFGSKRSFIETIELINRRISPATTIGNPTCGL